MMIQLNKARPVFKKEYLAVNSLGAFDIVKLTGSNLDDSGSEQFTFKNRAGEPFEPVSLMILKAPVTAAPKATLGLSNAVESGNDIAGKDVGSIQAKVAE